MPELTAVFTGDGALLLFSIAGLAATAFAIVRDIPVRRQAVASTTTPGVPGEAGYVLLTARPEQASKGLARASRRV